MKGTAAAVMTLALLAGCANDDPKNQTVTNGPSASQASVPTSASPSASAPTQASVAEKQPPSASELELCAYLTEHVRSLRDGSPDVTSGFLSMSTGFGGGLMMAEQALVATLRVEAAKADLDSAALGGAPLRLSNALDIDLNGYVSAERAAAVGMAAVDVLARCVQHAGADVGTDADDLAKTFLWVSQGAIDETLKSSTVEQMCTLLGPRGEEINTDSLTSEPAKAVMLVSWMQTAALYECTDLVEESIAAAEKLL